MSDLVLIELIKTAFWLIPFLFLILLFRAELAQLIRSLVTFNVAGEPSQINRHATPLKTVDASAQIRLV